MFILEDGREHLYQWDVNRRVQVEDPTVTEVHFCNRTDDCSLVVKTYTDDTYDGKVYADIPNIILQNPWDIRVFAYCAGGYTKVERIFEVKARSKPADYVYTETEVKNFESLEKHLDERIDEIAREGIKADLTGYAKEQWVKDQGYLTEHQDLSNYAKHTDIPTKVSQLDNDKGYLTKHQDISHLATISQVQTVEGKIPTKTSQLVDDRGFLTKHQDISHLAPKTSIPTKVSQLTNDKNYITSIPSEYVTEAELSAKNYLTEHQSLAAYATKAFVENTVAENQPNLTAYAKKSDIPDVSEFITAIPSEYVTESELNAKGFLTEHQDISGKADKVHSHNEYALKTEVPSIAGLATEKYVDDAIAGIEIPEGGGGTGGVETPVYTHHINIGYGCIRTDIDNANNSVNLTITNKSATPFTLATLREFLSANNYILKSSNDYADYYPATGGLIIDRHEITSISATEVTPTEVIGIGLLTNYIRAVTNSGNGATHTIHTIDKAAIAASSTDYYECFHDKVLKAENIVINSSGGSSGEEVDLSDYYTKAEVDELIPEATDLTGYATEAWVTNQGYLKEHQNLDEYAKKTDIPDISGKADKVHSHPEYLTEHQSLAGYATEKYVDDAIAGIEITEGGSDNTVVFITTDNTVAEVEAIIAAGKSPVVKMPVLTSNDFYYYHLTEFTLGDYTFESRHGEYFARYYLNKNSGTWRQQSHTPFQKKLTVNPSETTEVLTGLTIDNTSYAIPSADLTGYATKEYVDGLFAGIATAEGGAY